MAKRKSRKQVVHPAGASSPAGGTRLPGEHASAVHSRQVLAWSIALLTVLVYLRCLKDEFLVWDDEVYITNNPLIRSFDPHLVKSWFLSFHASIWHPLTWMTHALDYAVWGMNPVGHHLTNVLLHGLNTAIVVLLVVRLLAVYRRAAGTVAAPWLHEHGVLITAGIAGLLFGLHPLHVESVAWATERKDLLYALFSLLSVTAYLKYAGARTPAAAGDRGKPYYRDRTYWSSFGLFVLAAMSKPMAITLPLVLLMIDWHPAARIRSWKTFSTALIEKWPFLLVSAGLAALTLRAEQAALWLMQTVSLRERLLTAGHSLAVYLLTIAWPLHLTPFYAYGTSISLFTITYGVPLVLVTAISAGAALTASRNRTLFLAWVFFVVTLLPVLGIVQAGAQAMADRFLYLPSLSLFLLIGLGVARIRHGLSEQGGRLLLIAGALVIIALAALTIRQIGFWQNDVVLWSRAIDVEKSALVYWNRGVALTNRGLFDQALADYDSAISLDPAYTRAYLNRGMIYSERGQSARALSDFDRAIELDPRLSDAYNDKANIYCKSGQVKESIEQFDRAIALDPENPVYYYNRCQALHLLGETERALKDIDKALALNPSFKEAYSVRAEFLLKTKKAALALPDLRKACDLGDPVACSRYNELTTPAEETGRPQRTQ